MTVRRPLLLPLLPLYGGALWLKRWLGAEHGRQLAWAVVSVGSLSAGGAGKTPVVAALATLLLRSGWGVDVLSRGYGRASTGVVRVDPGGTAERFGDEPLLLARSLGVPVYVGTERYAAGLLAEQSAPNGERALHILDDGFQHRGLARALDVVLLTAEDAADRLLPAGNLREPLSRLNAADAVVLREDEEAALRPIVERFGGPPVWIIRRHLVMESWPTRPLAFCGIARPNSFFDMLRGQGIDLAATVAFRDHHPYRQSDVRRLMEQGRRSGAATFVTTDKDAVRLTEPMRCLLATLGPITVARLEVSFLQEGEVLRQVEAAFGGGPA